MRQLFIFNLVIIGVLAIPQALAESKRIEYALIAYGNLTYTVDDKVTQYKHKKTDVRIRKFLEGTKICVTSEHGMLLLRDAKGRDQTIRKKDGCSITKSEADPSFISTVLMAIRVHFSESKLDGEGTKSGASRGFNKSKTGILLNPQGGVKIVNDRWFTPDSKLPITLHVTNVHGDVVFEQLSRAKKITYFDVPSSVLPDKEGASLKVTNNLGHILLNIVISKGITGDWGFLDKK